MLGRREFFRVTSTAAILSTWAKPCVAATQPPVDDGPMYFVKPKLKKALKYSMIEIPGTPKDKLKAVKGIGFDGVEIDRPGKDDLAELLAASKAADVTIHGVINSVHWSKPLSSPKAEVRAEGLAALRTALKDAAYVKADTVLLVPGVVNKDVSYDECWERSTAEIKKALPDAEKAKVKIAIETVWNQFITRPNQLVEFIDQFDSPWVGAYFDVSNMLKFGAPASAWIRTLDKRLLKIDFKAYSIPKAKAAKDDWKGFDVPIGEGSENWPDVLLALGEVGYKTWATAEVKGGDLKWLREVSDRMTKILELDQM